MNRKGILLRNIMSLIIAVIGIVLIIIALVGVYNVFVNNDIRAAKKTLESIDGKINRLGNDQVGTATVRNVPDWFITTWSRGYRQTSDGSAVSRPEKCLFDSCICICKGEAGDIKSTSVGWGTWPGEWQGSLISIYTGVDMQKVLDKCQKGPSFCQKYDVDYISLGIDGYYFSNNVPSEQKSYKDVSVFLDNKARISAAPGFGYDQKRVIIFPDKKLTDLVIGRFDYKEKSHIVLQTDYYLK